MKDQTTRNLDQPCEDFKPHFFKPATCINCFLTKSKHDTTPQLVSNQDLNEKNQVSSKMRAKSGSYPSRELLQQVSNPQVSRNHNEQNGHTKHINQHPKNTENDETCCSRTTKELRERFESRPRSTLSSSSPMQNGSVSPKPVKRSSRKTSYVPLTIPPSKSSEKDTSSGKDSSSERDTSHVCDIATEKFSSSTFILRPTGPSDKLNKSEKLKIQGGKSEAQILSGNNPSNAAHDEENDDIYEVIYPTKTEEEDKNTKDSKDSSGFLTVPRMEQRSHSDAASYNPQISTNSRPKSIGTVIPGSMLEFQKIASRLKHSHRSFDEEGESVTGDKESIGKKERQSESNLVIPGSPMKRKATSLKTASEILSLKSCYSEELNSFHQLGRSRGCNTVSNENGCDTQEAENKQSETEDHDEEHKEPLSPGFMMESLMPETVKIISADGTVETVSPRSTVSQKPSLNSAKPYKIVDIPCKSETEVTTKFHKEPSMSSTPIEISNSDKVESCFPDQNKSSINSQDVDLYELGTLESNNNSKDLGTDTLLPDKRATPPFPIILEGQGSVISKKRDSGTYKVPIFITPQHYDNIGTVIADRDYEEAKRESIGNLEDQDQYYLTPKEETSADGVQHSPDDYECIEPSKRQGGVFHHENSSICPIHGKPRLHGPEQMRRSRSRTHPLSEEEEEQPIYEEQDQVVSHSPKSRSKRNAPLPPNEDTLRGSWSLDTMPRSPPPPPPLEGHRRLSKDLQDTKRERRSLTDPYTDLKHDEKMTKNTRLFLSKGSEGSDKGKLFRKKVQKVCEGDNIRPREKIKRNNSRSRKISLPDRLKTSSSPVDISPSKDITPQKPFISPPRLSLIHQLNLSGSPPTAHESRSKEKKSKLPWKRKKRKDEGGSPEREYDTEIVTRWLETIEPPTTEVEQRNSWERMEVINAYKGEHTAVIGYKRETKAYPEDMPDCPLSSGGCKRKAPKPPAPTKPQRKISESSLLKSSSDSQLRTLQDELNSADSRDSGYDPPDMPVYENIGNLRPIGKPPPKPQRRRVRGERSLTTAFENMPSRIKRMAPQPPPMDQEVDPECPSVAHSNPDMSSMLPRSSYSSSDADCYPSSSSPLKSAMKNSDTKSESEFERSDETPPKRPVRVFVPSQEIDSDAEGEISGMPLSKYINLAVVHKGSTEIPSNSSQVALSDRESWDYKSLHDHVLKDAALVLEQTRVLQAELLAEFAGLNRSAEFPDYTGTSWEDYVIHCKTLSVGTEQTFFKAALKCMPDKDVGLMVFHSEGNLQNFCDVSEQLMTMKYNPHVLQFRHVFKTQLPVEVLGISAFEIDQSQTCQPRNSQSDLVSCVVVVTTQVPLESATDFTANQKDYHQECPEKYEMDVFNLVMQVCFGIAHFKNNDVVLSGGSNKNVSLDNLKLDLILRCVGNVWVLNPISFDSLTFKKTQKHSTESHLVDKSCEFDLGLLIYELLHQCNPFTNLTDADSEQQQSTTQLSQLKEISKYSCKLQRIVQELLLPVPEERLRAKDTLWLMFCMLHGPPHNLIPHEVSDEDRSKILKNWIILQVTEKVCRVARKGLRDVPLSVAKRLEYACWSSVNEKDILTAMQILRK